LVFVIKLTTNLTRSSVTAESRARPIYQSKAHMQLPISDKLTSCLAAFPSDGLIIGQIFASEYSDRGVPHFNALARVI